MGQARPDRQRVCVFMGRRGAFRRALEDANQCILVVIGPTADGRKSCWRCWMATASRKHRGKSCCWAETTRAHPRPESHGRDGALGFWKALPQVFGTTREQRCWVHKTANVLNHLPKSQQAKAKADIHEIWMAQSRLRQPKPWTSSWLLMKASECLAKDGTPC